jgi:hypothetical protein
VIAFVCALGSAQALAQNDAEGDTLDAWPTPGSSNIAPKYKATLEKPANVEWSLEAEYGVTPEDIVDGRADADAISLVVEDVLGLAEGYYQSGDAGMRFLPTRARWAVLVASRLYRGIGRRLRRRQHSNPLLGRVVVPWFEKVALVMRATGTWRQLSIRPPKIRRTRQARDYLDGLPYSGS